MKKNNKGFVVSAVLYPLLVLFLALIMGLLAMTDTRKRILDRMKLEISDSIFDEATCSCDTILNKLNYIIKNGVGGGGSSNIPGEIVSVDIKVTGYEAESELPASCTQNEIAVITTTEISKYYLSATTPINPEEGQVWIVQDNTSKYHLTTEESQIGISYAMQYENGKWELKKSYLCQDGGWQLLYYVDLENSEANIQTVFNYDYTGEYQEFVAPFSGYYLVELWGAQGGTVHAGGGNGAYTYGDIYLNAGTKFYVYVGGAGSGSTGGWNGGGNSGNYGGGGGGSTDIRLLPTSSTTLWNEFESLKARIMVAAGGGGGSYNASGGAGGGLIGYNGGTWVSSSNHSATAGIGATQSMPGYLALSSANFAGVNFCLPL